jgi:hypothetical protein
MENPKLERLFIYVAVVKIAIYEELSTDKMMEIGRIVFKPTTKLAEDRLWNKLKYIHDVLKISNDIDADSEMMNRLPFNIREQIHFGTYQPPEPREKSEPTKKSRRKNKQASSEKNRDFPTKK